MKYSQIEGAAFDVDETILSNRQQPLIGGLHERSRLMATRQVGKRLNSQKLQMLSEEENFRAFEIAKTNTVEAAIWGTLHANGVVNSDEIDLKNPILQEILSLKDQFYVDMLRREGVEVPGASHFIGALANAGLRDRMAIASSALRRDINIFLREVTQLEQYFPDHHVISRESVTHPKPHPQAFNSAFLSLGIPESARQNVLAVEDDPRGIESAARAGLYVCAITTRFDRERLESLPVPPMVVVDSFVELEQVLELPQQ